jgi:hypothetical protein
VNWPSGKKTILTKVTVNQTLFLSEVDAAVVAIENPIILNSLFQKIPNYLDYKHIENRFIDFDRDRLLNHMCSTEGPKMSMADVNGDGHNDLFIGGSKGTPASLYLGNGKGFKQSVTDAFEQNKDTEDAASLFFDADNDGDLDLYVCSGGVEFSQYSTAFLDHFYINDGKGNFTLSNQKLPNANSLNSTATVVASDIDGDGDLDLFVGERVIPLQYGQRCSGFILQNDGKGNFTDITKESAKELTNLGMITDALFQDLDQDGDEDLVVVGEFMGIELFLNTNGVFTKMKNNPLSDLKGWWNVIYPSDLDGDGDIDFIVGNHGLNSSFKASAERPITLYSKDFDKNGFIDPILTFRSENGKDYPYALRHNLIDQIKGLKKRFPDYDSFKDASIKDIFSPTELDNANQLVANTLSTVVIINEGNLKFSVKPLPIEAQFSTIYAIITDDFDNDGDQDIVLGGNLYSVKPEVGRYDASYGVYLENLGKMEFKSYNNEKRFSVKGEIRDFAIDNHKLFIARNSDSLVVLKY